MKHLFKHHALNTIATQKKIQLDTRRKDMKGNIRYTLRNTDNVTELLHATGLKLYERSLSTIQHLQKANKMVQKQLTDTYTHMDIKMLIYQIKQQDWIDYDRFNAVYTDFVERKRQNILKEINRIDTQFMTELRRRNEAGLPNKGMPAETQMKKAVLETCYAYLANDDVYQQRAFELFLKKKMAKKGADYSRIKNYLENKHRNSNYEEYIMYISTPIIVHLPDLWIEFLRSGAGYGNVVQKELPNVMYSRVDTGIPCFIFDKPYKHEYTEQEFYIKFIEEWSITHYNPYYYDDDCDDPVYYADYDMQLADKPENAYQCYFCAVNRYKCIMQMLNADKGGER